MLSVDGGDLVGPCMLLEQFLTGTCHPFLHCFFVTSCSGTAALSVADAAQLRPALVQYEASSLR
jgi:hypothetical protein